MSNIIKGIDFGMGYEQATKWEPGVQVFKTQGEFKGQWKPREEDWQLFPDILYRRPLPILANHPEAIPLEPGEVLQVGDRGLTRDGRDTGVLEQSLEEFYVKAGLTLHSRALNLFYTPDGHFHVTKTNDRRDIIARLPKVEKEDEKAKEEKVESGTDNSTPSERCTIPVLDYFVEPWKSCKISPTEAARIYLENESVRAEVKRQEESKRIGPGDWVIDDDSKLIMRVEFIRPDTGVLVGRQMSDGGTPCFTRDHARKLNLPPEAIAALNAEIDAKAGG